MWTVWPEVFGLIKFVWTRWGWECHEDAVYNCAAFELVALSWECVRLRVFEMVEWSVDFLRILWILWQIWAAEPLYQRPLTLIGWFLWLKMFIEPE